MASTRLSERDVSERIGSDADDGGFGPAFFASAASVALSLYYYFVRGDKRLGTFVGLWPPTILAFAIYLNQREMRRRVEAITRPGSTIRDAIDSMMGNQ